MNDMFRDHHKRKGNSQLKRAFEVRFKTDGRFLSRQLDPGTINHPGQAAALVSGNGRKILGVRKVRPMDVIGTIKSMGLQDIIGVERRQEDVILDNATLDSIVFPHVTSHASKSRKKFKGKYNQSRRFGDENE